MGVNGSNNEKVAVQYSLKTRIAILVVLAVIFSTVFNLIILVPYVRGVIEEQNTNYLLDLSVTNGRMLENLAKVEGNEYAYSYEELSKVFEGVGIEGMDSSYAYVVSSSGIMLYHPVQDKVGKLVENKLVSGLVVDISNGIRKNSEIVEYEYDDAVKCASYYIISDCSAIVVVAVDEVDIHKTASGVAAISIIIGIVAVLIFAALGFVMVAISLKPLDVLSSLVERMASLDFSKAENLDSYSARKDEIGVMSRSIDHLRKGLVGVVDNIRKQSSLLYQASEKLTNNAIDTNSTMGQVENAVGDIANGATNQAQETQAATENVISMGNMIEATTDEVSALKYNADEMKRTSDSAQAILNELIQENERTRVSIDEIYEQTNTTNESALRIKEATAIITSIAEETNLLSLNASIEAARAGEQGRGFAVVAAQIQKLAEQSSESAQKIEQITNLLISDSTKAVKTMKIVKDNMDVQSDKMVQTDKMFEVLNSGVQASIESVDNIAYKTDTLDESRVKVVDLVQSLSAIAEENAASSQQTSASVTQVSEFVNNISDNASQLKFISQQLEDVVNDFKL